METLAQSMSYRGTIGGAVPISTIANRATSGWRRHHHKQQQKLRHSTKMANEEQYEATYLYMSFVMSMVSAQTGCTMVHSPSRCLFLSDSGDNSNTVSFDFWFTTPGKNLKHAQNAKSNSPRVSPSKARLVWLSTELSQSLNLTASNPIRFNF